MGHVLDNIIPIALTVIGTALGQPELGAIASGIYTGVKNHDPLAGIAAAGGSYFGGQLGSSLGSSLGTVGGALGDSAGNAVGPAFGSIGGAVGDTLGPAIGSGAANSIGAAIANTSIGGALGSYAGNSLAQGAFAQPPQMQGPATPPPFKPSQQAQSALPSSLSDFANLSPLQQSTNLATQGVYGGGLGPEEQQYFLNLENRKLVDSGGQTSDQSTLSPIEDSFLSKLGLGGKPDTSSLLQAISQWSPA